MPMNGARRRSGGHASKPTPPRWPGSSRWSPEPRPAWTRPWPSCGSATGCSWRRSRPAAPAWRSSGGSARPASTSWPQPGAACRRSSWTWWRPPSGGRRWSRRSATIWPARPRTPWPLRRPSWPRAPTRPPASSSWRPSWPPWDRSTPWPWRSSPSSASATSSSRPRWRTSATPDGSSTTSSGPSTRRSCASSTRPSPTSTSTSPRWSTPCSPGGRAGCPSPTPRTCWTPGSTWRCGRPDATCAGSRCSPAASARWWHWPSSSPCSAAARRPST